jgi:hypothetical protein
MVENERENIMLKEKITLHHFEWNRAAEEHGTEEEEAKEI